MKALSLFVLAWWLLALVRTVVNLLLVPRLRAGVTPGDALVSIVVPARDEERAIERTVRALLDQTHRNLEVIVVNDRSVDGTGEILARIAAEDARLIVLDGVEPPEGWLGKPWALHQGSLRARGALMLFVDADVLYEREAVAGAVEYLERSGVAMVSLLPHFELRGFWEHVVMPNLAVVAFSALPLWLANRTRVPFLAIGGGPGNLVRRSDYEAAGGHEALRNAVIDDVALGRLLRRRGLPTHAVRAEEQISVRMYHGGAEIVHGFTKNAFAVFDYSYVVAAIVVTGGAVTNVLPYVLAATGDTVSLATVAIIALTRLILFIPFRYGILNALLGHPLMNLAWFYILGRSIWLTGIRRRLLWRGRAYDARGTKFGA
jgi:chlorobactene glucosyltransferase